LKKPACRRWHNKRSRIVATKKKKPMAKLLPEAMKEELCLLVDDNADEYLKSLWAAYELGNEEEFTFKIPITLKFEVETRHKVGVEADSNAGVNVKKKRSTAGRVVSDRDERTLFNQDQCLNCGERVKKKGDELCPTCAKMDPGEKEARRKAMAKGKSAKSAKK
jgi:hypothetical protein